MDPRCAIAGREAGFSDSSGASLGADAGWESGLFDRGSWIEAQVRMALTHMTHLLTAHLRWSRHHDGNEDEHSEDDLEDV